MNKQPTKSPTAATITLGCKVNQYDSEAIGSDLQRQGWDYDSDQQVADLLIINTCTVTKKAAMQSRQAIRKAIRKNPNALIIATGCYAQFQPDVLNSIEGIDYIIGNSEKHRIGEIISSKLTNQKAPTISCLNEFPGKLTSRKNLLYGPNNRTRPYVKIQDGCENYCTYCIVPYTRGPSRSLSPDDVIFEIENLSRQGASEIVLTGIHLGKYGQDLSPPINLLKLLTLLQKSNIIRRVRLSSIEPDELTEDIIDFAATSDLICDHFHIPLQSGDKGILKKMNRNYDPTLLHKIVERIHNVLPNAAIGVDVLIGFPGETEEAFNNTYKLINDLPISYLHVFPFSDHPNTPANRLSNKNDAPTIRIRCEKIRRLGYRKKTDFYNRMIEKTVEVLVENQCDRATGLLKGVSSNYIKVLMTGEDHFKNKIISCKIQKNNNIDSVYGKIIQ